MLSSRVAHFVLDFLVFGAVLVTKNEANLLQKRSSINVFFELLISAYFASCVMDFRVLLASVENLKI